MKTFTFLLLALSLSAAARADGFVPATRVLFLSDSHGLGPFGAAMDEGLRAIPAVRIDTYAIGGSAPTWWFYNTMSACGYEGHWVPGTPAAARTCARMRTPLLSVLLETPGQFARAVTVVEQGANQVLDPADYARKAVVRMATAIQKAGEVCIWIGPPRMRRFTDAQVDAIYAVTAEGLKEAAQAVGGATEPCLYLDSRGMTHYPETGGDGVHYSFPAGEPIARQWGQTLSARIVEVLGEAPGH